MNRKYMSILLLAVAALMVCVLYSCGIGRSSPEKETAGVQTVEETAMETESSAAEDTVETTEEATTAPTVVYGMSDDEAETMVTIPIEERPVVTTPVENENHELTDYEKYLAMTGEEQYEFKKSFESTGAFFEWYNAAKEEYEEAKKDIVISGDEIIKITD